MKYKIFIPILFIIIITMYSNIVLADDENIDIVNIPGQTSLPVTAIPSDNIDIVNIPGQKSEEVTAIPSEDNLANQKSEEVKAIPSQEHDDYKTNGEDITEQKNIEQEQKEETKENITKDNTIIEKNKNNEVVQGGKEEKRNSGIEYKDKTEYSVIWSVLVVFALITILGTIISNNKKE